MTVILRKLHEGDLPALGDAHLQDWHTRQPEGHIRRCQAAVDDAKQDRWLQYDCKPLPGNYLLVNKPQRRRERRENQGE